MQIAIPLSKSSGSLSRQIYQALREGILSGAYPQNSRLPSTRDLAEQLHVSRTVVVLAYDQLLAEGYVEGRHGSGTYVGSSLESSRRKSVNAAAKISLSRYGSKAALAASRLKTKPDFPRGVRYDFALRHPAIEGFPFETWRRILFRKTRAAGLADLDYGSSIGDPRLREAIASHLRRARAVRCDAEQVIVLNGSQQALDLTARVLLDPGDGVVLEDPHYRGAYETFLAAGARIRAIPVDSQGIQVEKFPSKAKLAFVTPSHQYPSGAMLSLPRRMQLLEWAKQNDSVVVEDDYDGEFYYEGHPVESLQGLDQEGRVLYIGTFSRTIFPALRLGYLVVPPSLVQVFTTAKWLCDRHTPMLEQATLAEFLESGAYERHLRKLRRRNALRRRALLDAIDAYLPGRVTVTGDCSGTHLVLWPTKKGSEESFIEAARRRQVGIYPIAQNFSAPGASPGLMLGFARMREKDIREGIRRLAEVL